MIIKHADDKQAHKAQLQALLSHPNADDVVKKRIEQELRNIQAGLKGEEEAAYVMSTELGESKNWMILHDLRIEYKDTVAQIDHLLINRFLEMWVCESKHFSEGIAINEHGEFTAFFGSKPYGIPSPIEQNNRHISILNRVFDSGAIKLPKRLGFTLKPEFKNLVLVSQRARIIRPPVKTAGIEAVIKNDQLMKTIIRPEEEIEARRIAKVVSSETIQTLAQSIASLHKPIEFNWSAKFGLPDIQPIEKPKKQKLVCYTCTEAVPYNVAKFCWFNKPKFGGNLYCMDCQKNVVAESPS